MDYQYILYNTCYGGFAVSRKFLTELFKYAYDNNKISEFFRTKMLKTTKNEIIEELKEYNEYDNVEYFHDYLITEENIYNFENNTEIDISPYNYNIRSNQFTIEYIFDRCCKKIIFDDNFTPFFYYFLSKLKPTIYGTKIENTDINQLVDIDHILTEQIDNFVPQYKTEKIPKNLLNNDKIDNIKFYKNGIKINEEYYKFKFDTNINKNNIYDILYNINEVLFDFLLFYDINDRHSKLSVEKVKTCYAWSIREYDGKEDVILKLPYDKIIEDILNKLWKTENYINKSVLTDSLIDKVKTIKELNEDKYK